MGVKISELPAATALVGTEVFPLVQAGETRQATVAELMGGSTGYPSNLISSPVTVPADASYIVMGELRIESDFTNNGNVGIL
jgi:hypothetical protein